MIDYDIELLGLINSGRIESFDIFLAMLSQSAYYLCIVAVAIVGLLAYFRKSKKLGATFYLICISLVLNTTVTLLLKYAILRPRPFLIDTSIIVLSTANSPSFPSGHATTAFLMFFCAMFYLKQKRVFLVFIFIWAVLISYSRIALGVHYPSDVLGGIVLAFFSSMTVYCFAETLPQKIVRLFIDH